MSQSRQPMRTSQNGPIGGNYQPTNYAQPPQQQFMGGVNPQQQQMMTSMPDNRFLREAFSAQQTPSQQPYSQTPQSQNQQQFAQQKQQPQPANMVAQSQNFQQQQQNYIQQMLQTRMKQQQFNLPLQQNQQQIPSQQSFGQSIPPQITTPTGQQVVSMRSSMQQQQNFAGIPPLSQQSSYSQQIQGDQSNDNFKVVIRVRPPLPRECVEGCEFRPIVSVAPNNKTCSIMEYLGAEVNEQERQKDIDSNPHLVVWQNFTFDYVYDEQATQEYVYENTAKQAVLSVLEGYNATILAYGQTGTGKTYTMEGFKYSAGDPQRGIVPRSMEEIFRFIQMQSSQNTTFMVRASYLQIYNEVISDLLKIDRTSLQIREDKKKGVFVEGLSEWAVRSPNEIYSLMQKGALSRATATTKMNDLSSRSHAVFIIIVEQMTNLEDQYEDMQNGEDSPKQIKVGKLNLVDLAGSERVRVTGATGKRLEESKKINQSLSCLGNVIAALTDQKPRSHIPYRDSKLTRLLEDSLGGNCKTTMMAMISPSSDAFGESLSTLKFATRAKKIKNEAKINEDVDQRALLRKYEVELRRLKMELDDRNKGGNVDNKHLTQLELEKRKAEEEKSAAITALEMRSKEYMQEREEKKRLEEKIKMMNSQMLIGGKKIEDTPQFRTALEAKQKIIRQEYEQKLQEIEKERNQIEEDKAQVDRYKQLLLKQRDIMIALTSRLNERDETIIQLQEELDAYDRIHRETEQVIEVRQMRAQQLEEFIREQGMEPPQCQFSQQEEPFFYNQLYNHQRQNSIMGSTGVAQERRYQPYIFDQHDSYQPQLLTADEKIQEMQNILEQQQIENQQVKQQMEQLGNDKITFVREKIDDLVHKEVQLKLNSIAANTSQDQSRVEEVQSLRQQIDHSLQEKQAYLLISNDIQGLLSQALQELNVCQNDPYKIPQAQQRLNDVNNLVNSLQKHLQAASQPKFQQPRFSTSSNLSAAMVSAVSQNENQAPQRIKSSSLQASPTHHQTQLTAQQQQFPFNPNVYNQRVGSGQQQSGTPRGQSAQAVQQQQPLPPRNASQPSGQQQQQQLANDKQQNMPVSVSEMLRKRQEQRKVQ